MPIFSSFLKRSRTLKSKILEIMEEIQWFQARPSSTRLYHKENLRIFILGVARFQFNLSEESLVRWDCKLGGTTRNRFQKIWTNTRRRSKDATIALLVKWKEWPMVRTLDTMISFSLTRTSIFYQCAAVNVDFQLYCAVHSQHGDPLLSMGALFWVTMTMGSGSLINF